MVAFPKAASDATFYTAAALWQPLLDGHCVLHEARREGRLATEEQRRTSNCEQSHKWIKKDTQAIRQKSKGWAASHREAEWWWQESCQKAPGLPDGFVASSGARASAMLIGVDPVSHLSSTIAASRGPSSTYPAHAVMRPFPQELIDEVLCHLHDDKPALSSSALVCKSWSRTARTQLFRDIHITYDSMPKRPHPKYPFIGIPDWSAFVSAFRAMPTLAECVGSWKIQGFQMLWDKKDVDDQPEVGRRYDAGDEYHRSSVDSACGLNYVSLSLDMLHNMAQVMPKLKHLVLQDLILTPPPTALNVCSSTLIRLDCLRATQVGIIRGLNVLDTFLLFCPNEVDLDIVGWASAEFGESAVSWDYQSGLSIRTWSLRCEPQLHYILRGLVKAGEAFLDSMESLHVHISHAFELVMLVDVLRRAGSKLRKLSMDLRDAYMTLPAFMDLKRELLRRCRLGACSLLSILVFQPA